jgi:hypothetical protein
MLRIDARRSGSTSVSRTLPIHDERTRRRIIGILHMAHRRSELHASQKQLLDIHGLDLLSQGEAILRLVREYQSAVQELRQNSARRATVDSDPMGRIREYVKALRETCRNLGGTLDDIHDVLEVGGASEPAST